ncbi:hypothetical protein ACHAXS_000612, partial [Conticribra weissflogii]
MIVLHYLSVDRPRTILKNNMPSNLFFSFTSLRPPVTTVSNQIMVLPTILLYSPYKIRRPPSKTRRT